MWLAFALQSVLQFNLIGLPLPAQQESVNDFHMQHVIDGDREHCFCSPAHTFKMYTGKLWNVDEGSVLKCSGCLLVLIPNPTDKNH